MNRPAEMSEATPVPRPEDWSRVYGLLDDAWKARGAEGIPRPPVPLILAGASVSTPSQIKARWRELILWANQFGYAQLLQDSLPPPPLRDIADDIAGARDDGPIPWLSTADVTSDVAFLSEDTAKRHLQTWLQASGWEVIVMWGRDRGIDLLATKGRERWIIEVKGEGSRAPMRVNYFLAILGETLQRMSDPDARYSIALPDVPQFRGLWTRLPQLAKSRTGITALFVARDGTVQELT